MGYLKEGADIYKKYHTKPMKDILLDSFKDLGNNWDGLVSGINDKGVFRQEFQNFDYKHNRRRNR